MNRWSVGSGDGVPTPLNDTEDEKKATGMCEKQMEWATAPETHGALCQNQAPWQDAELVEVRVWVCSAVGVRLGVGVAVAARVLQPSTASQGQHKKRRN